MKDYYKILGVEQSDSIITIKRVFRRLAVKMHPDVDGSPDAHEKFVELNEAYQVLCNHTKRRQYDFLYDVQVLNKPLKQKTKYERKHQNWESNIDRTVKKGQARGRKYAAESKKRFKRRVDWWGTSIILDLLIELVFRTIGFLIGDLEQMEYL